MPFEGKACGELRRMRITPRLGALYALKVLRYIGFPEEIVERAEERAQDGGTSAGNEV